MADELRFSQAAKIWITSTLCLVMTALFVFTKLSFLSLSQLLAEAKPKEGPFDYKQLREYAGLHVIIYLVIVIPYFLTILRALLNAVNSEPFHYSNNWYKILGAVVLTSVLEPIGLFLLAFLVLPNIDPFLGVLITSSFTLIFPIIFKFFFNIITRNFKCTIDEAILIFLFFVYFIGLTLYMWWLHGDNTKYWIWCHVCFACLGIAWFPDLQKYLADREHNPGPTLGSNTSYYGDEKSWWMVFLIYLIKSITFTICVGVAFLFNVVNLPNVDVGYNSILADAWDLTNSVNNMHTWMGFGVNLAAGFIGYAMVVFVFQTNMHRSSFGLPFVLSIPVSLIFVSCGDVCEQLMDTAVCDKNYDYVQSSDHLLIYLAPVVLCIALCLYSYLFLNLEEEIDLKQEWKIFWIPSYNGAALESWLLLNRRQTLQNNEKSARIPANHRSRVYICTTMYREDKKEMKQLLKSLDNINKRKENKDLPADFEAHIIFDGGIHNNEFSEFALTLISLLKEILEIELKHCIISDAPFGKKLSCKMKKDGQLKLNIYFKDNRKVKNKKRWSQVMYISHIINFLSKEESGALQTKPAVEPFILATDADVMFTTESVESLLRLMIRDKLVGAVCGRTIPTGSGYIVWYQKFEYAVGHWFQKTAEHVLGSVMCAPGCFSLYRCKALEGILKEYCSNVEEAFDFLTKDMGEDRWMCTLLLLAGRKIEYCAASENKTYCPNTFEELFKQRRRWVASTLANMFLIMKKWNRLRKKNRNFTFIYFIYQGLQLFATLIAPSMVILIVSGGLHFAWTTNEISSSVLQVFFIIVFVVACLYATSNFQLMAAKIYTAVYAIIMCAVIVGTIEQLVRDIRDQYDDDDDTVFSVFNDTNYDRTTKRPDHHISNDIPVSATTLYLSIMVGMYLIGGFLHPRDIPIIVHGIWYLLCLPSAFLILPIYSICNLTDSSWGTREETSTLKLTKLNEWKYFFNWLYKTFCCCCSRRENQREHAGVQTANKETLIDLEMTDIPPAPPAEQFHQQENAACILEIDLENVETRTKCKRRQNGYCIHPVEEWLHEDLYRLYAATFEENGFENTLFVKGINEKDLRDIGIKEEGHVFFILDMAEKIPPLDYLDYRMPENVNDWLDDIGLPMYKTSSTQNETDLMVMLKDFNTNAVKKTLNMKKLGHMKRLLYAIEKIKMTERQMYLTKHVKEWPLPKKIQEEDRQKLEDTGFDNTMLIKGINEEDLTKIEIPADKHNIILDEASKFPDFDFDLGDEIPENVNDWLDKIGLSMYKNNFKKIKSKGFMEILKEYGTEKITNNLKITKYGHIKRLLYAIRKIGKDDFSQPVEDWLPRGICTQYASAFRSHGFENTMFIKGITEAELFNMGIRKKKHVDSILAKANNLPSFDLDYGIPENVNDWLDKIGLTMYKTNFLFNKFVSGKSLGILKGFDSKAIQDELKITKYGHVKRLLCAIRNIGEPTEEQIRINQMRRAVKTMPIKNMDDSEYSHWNKLVDDHLQTPQKEFGNHDQINAKLLKLRNSWLLMFIITNTMWLISISTIANKWILTVIGENPFGLLFVVIFGLLLSIQFLAMLAHRMQTICHYMVRQPLHRSNPLPCCCKRIDESENLTEQNDDSHVEQNDDSRVEQNDDSHVEQNDDSHVEQNDESHVEQNDDSHVEQNDDLRVEQNDDLRLSSN